MVSNVLYCMRHFKAAETGVHSAGTIRMRPSLPLRCITTRRLSLIITSIIISSGLGRDLHGQKVICRHGFEFIFIRHIRHRLCFRSQFHWKLAGGGSPCFTGLSLDLTNYGNPFSGFGTWERGGEPGSRRNKWRAVKHTNNE